MVDLFRRMIKMDPALAWGILILIFLTAIWGRVRFGELSATAGPGGRGSLPGLLLYAPEGNRSKSQTDRDLPAVKTGGLCFLSKVL